MALKIEVLLTPAELPSLTRRDLKKSVCVVFDVLRATSVIVTALANGAEAFIPVEEIAEAVAEKQQRPGALLAGERDGVRIGGALAGGVEFDFGNSPREFTPDKVAGKIIISTTTNGTRALRACAKAQCVLAGSFLNLQATADFLTRLKTANLVLVCAGTGENAALEDTLAAGELCAHFAATPGVELLDSAKIAFGAYREAKADISSAVHSAQNARRLLANPELREDVAFCLRRNSFPIVTILGPDGLIRKAS